MKEIVAVIRPGKDRETKEALAKIGCVTCTSFRVFGRGRQRGLRYQPLGVSEPSGMRYLPKKLLCVVVGDRRSKLVVQTILRVNQTGQYGDGKIFVSEANEVIRVRTGEKGEAAIA